MSSSPAREIPVPSGVRRGLLARSAPASWRLSTLTGRFAELCSAEANASLTLAFRIVLEAQRIGEPVAWIAGRAGTFFPPDVAAAGVDLAALPVIRVTDPIVAARAADRLLRSGAFGLLVLDLGRNVQLPFSAQTRLVGLTHKHDAALLCITEKDPRQASVGALISLRAEALRGEKKGEGFQCEARILKDKRGRPGWSHAEVCRAPDGLC